MEEFLQTWGYLGVFLGILSTGIPFFPMPEELPVVIGGALVSHKDLGLVWWIMLPVCIVAVVIGDAMLYGAGRLWGTRLLEFSWIKKHVLPPERLKKIEDNFDKHGIKILLFARLTPGIRAPIFVTAGLVRLSLVRFIIADALYAVPGVALLFSLGYWFTEGIVNLIKNDLERVKWIVILAMLVLVTGYFLYRFLRKPIVTGDPGDMPPLVENVSHKLEQMTSKIMKPRGQESGARGQGTGDRGQESGGRGQGARGKELDDRALVDGDGKVPDSTEITKPSPLTPDP